MMAPVQVCALGWHTHATYKVNAPPCNHLLSTDGCGCGAAFSELTYGWSRHPPSHLFAQVSQSDRWSLEVLCT